MYPSITPSSFPWFSSLWLSALQTLKFLLPSVAPRWLARWLGPEGRQRKRKTLRVNQVRDRISLHRRELTAMPAGGIGGGRKDEGRGTYLPGPIPVQSDRNRSAPCANHSSNHGIQEGTFGICSWSTWCYLMSGKRMRCELTGTRRIS